MEEPKSWQIGRSKVFLLLVGTVWLLVRWGRGGAIVSVLPVLFFGGAAVISLHLRKEEVQARLEKAIGEAVKAMQR